MSLFIILGGFKGPHGLQNFERLMLATEHGLGIFRLAAGSTPVSPPSHPPIHRTVFLNEEQRDRVEVIDGIDLSRFLLAAFNLGGIQAAGQHPPPLVAASRASLRLTSGKLPKEIFLDPLRIAGFIATADSIFHAPQHTGWRLN